MLKLWKSSPLVLVQRPPMLAVFFNEVVTRLKRRAFFELEEEVWTGCEISQLFNRISRFDFLKSSGGFSFTHPVYKLFVSLLIVLMASVRAGAQEDSVMYSPDLAPLEGVFLTYQDFRNNRVITKQQIVSDKEKERIEFIAKTLAAEKFSYSSGDQVITMESKKAWGFCQGNAFYINYNNEFYRIPVFGAICYFVANVKVVSPGVYDPRFGGYVGSVTTTETREFIMSFYNCVIKEFSQYEAEVLLSRDKVIYEEFKKLSRRKRKEQTYRYIRKYNEAHPIYFLKEKKG